VLLTIGRKKSNKMKMKMTSGRQTAEVQSPVREDVKLKRRDVVVPYMVRTAPTLPAKRRDRSGSKTQVWLNYC